MNEYIRLLKIIKRLFYFEYVKRIKRPTGIKRNKKLPRPYRHKLYCDYYYYYYYSQHIKIIKKVISFLENSNDRKKICI